MEGDELILFPDAVDRIDILVELFLNIAKEINTIDYEPRVEPLIDRL